ncbi:MAG TPA: hypothetical protein PK812_09860 [Beijerinckiaceae bacterium]|nr:hypothetical protein [Beijerinckiaceae bacterium]
MQVVCTRHAVSNGDDVEAPHRRSFDFPDGTELPDVLTAIARSGWLPGIAGGRATWSVASGRLVAVIAQEWQAPKFLPIIEAPSLDWRDGALFLHFNYHAQIDPETVYRIFWGMRLQA